MPIEEGTSEANEYTTVNADTRARVESAKSTPSKYRDGQSPNFSVRDWLSFRSVQRLHIEGWNRDGACVPKSPKNQGCRFTSTARPVGFADGIASELNEFLSGAATRRGYPDLIFRVRKAKKMSRSPDFEDHEFPALSIKNRHCGARYGRRKETGGGRGVADAAHGDKLRRRSARFGR